MTRQRPSAALEDSAATEPPTEVVWTGTRLGHGGGARHRPAARDRRRGHRPRHQRRADRRPRDAAGPGARRPDGRGRRRVRHRVGRPAQVPRRPGRRRRRDRGLRAGVPAGRLPRPRPVRREVPVLPQPGHLVEPRAARRGGGGGAPPGAWPSTACRSSGTSTAAGRASRTRSATARASATSTGSSTGSARAATSWSVRARPRPPGPAADGRPVRGVLDLPARGLDLGAERVGPREVPRRPCRRPLVDQRADRRRGIASASAGSSQTRSRSSPRTRSASSTSQRRSSAGKVGAQGLADDDERGRQVEVVVDGVDEPLVERPARVGQRDVERRRPVRCRERTARRPPWPSGPGAIPVGRSPAARRGAASGATHGPPSGGGPSARRRARSDVSAAAAPSIDSSE